MGTGDGRKIRVVEHTPEVGRSLGSIRNYNPRTELHVKLPEMKRRRRADETSGVIADSNPGQAIPALVNRGYDADIYVVDLYADGYHMAKTGEGYMYLPEITYGKNLSANTRIIVFSSMIETVDGELIPPEEGD